MQKKLLTMQDIAAILALSEVTVRHWGYGHRPPPENFPQPIRVGRQLRYVADELDDWICGLRGTQAAAPRQAAAGKTRGRPRKVRPTGGDA